MSINEQIENIESDLAELSSLESMAKRINVKTLLSTEIRRLEKKKESLSKQLSDTKDDKEMTSNDSKSDSVLNQGLGTIVIHNYMWDQNNDFVKIYIEIDKTYPLNDSMISLKFINKKGFTIIFGKFKFTLNKLNSDIDIDKSYHKITKSGKQLIIYLKKMSAKHWNSINEEENKMKKTLDENKDEMNGDPSASLMKLMKQMYDEGDDDMKRTIAKSWYESRNKDTSDITGFDSDINNL